MKRKLPLLLVLCLYNLLIANSGAQTLAISKSTFHEENSLEKTFQAMSLKSVLEELQNRYAVSIACKEDLVKNKEVLRKPANTETFEKELQFYLQQFDLEFLKVNEKFYIIQDKAEKAGLNHLESKKTMEGHNKNYYTGLSLDSQMRGLGRDLKFMETSGKSAIVKVSGTIYDEGKQPMPGVNILEKGTSNGTSTDAAGKYSLSVQDNAILIVSFIGYTTEEVPVENRSTLDITMLSDIQALSEMVVVGYGTQSKKDLTGSVSTINSDVLAKRQSVQVSDALQGTMAGVTVTRSDGQPGGGSSVRIRGVTSLNVNDPLVIVDGVPGLGLNDVNPNDIENISVLKDAASQAIYGARAAAGVILITTKRGKSGKLQLNYDYEFGSSKPTTLPTFVNAKTYRNMNNERSLNDGGGTVFDPAINDTYDELNRTDSDLYPDTDWQGLTLSNKTTNRHRHDLSMSVGTEKLKTRASIGYVSEDGLYANRNYERYTFRVNNNLQMFKWLEANVDVYYKRTEILEPSLDNVIRQSRLYPGIYSARRSDGLWGEGKDGDNNLAATVEGGTLKQKYNQISGIIGVTITPFEGLSIRANLSPTYNFNDYNEFTTPPLIPRQGSTSEFWPQRPTKLERRLGTNSTLTRQVTANYVRQLSNHNISVLLGYEEIGTKWQEVHTSSNSLAVNLPSLTFGDPSLTTNLDYGSENALRSYFGRFNYDYKGKYLIQTNLRADASSRFAPENRWGFFPSVSLGWVISNEDLFRLPEIMSLVKLRASYGEVGNERIGEDRTGGNEFFNFYPYQNLYERSTVIFYDGNFVPRTGIRQDFLPDPSIVWETTRTVDVGLDVGLFGNKIMLSADFYQKNTDDIILTLDLPNYLGYEDDTKTNVGSMKVSGLDVEASFRGSLGNLQYSIGANASRMTSEVTDVGGRNDFTTDGGTKINIKGSEFNEWFGYQTKGIYQTKEQVTDYGLNAAPGDIWIVDQPTIDSNNDGKPDTGDKIINERDRVPLGASLPKFTYGGNISVQFKGFDLSLVFNGVSKHTRIYDGFQVRPFEENFGNVPSVIVGKYWSQANTPEQNLSAQYPRLSGRSETNNYAVSDFWLFNGGYFRMKNVTLGYTLLSLGTSRIKLDQVRFYVGLRDYFTVQNNFLPGWDPESSNSGYPIMKSVLFGINVKL